MNAALLQDTIRRGLGRAAAVAGAWCDAYRPDGPHDPLAPANRFLRLPVVFAPPSGFGQPVGYGAAAWTGLFDAATTRPGDYLVRHNEHGGPDLWFIAAQQSLLPVLCIRATRLLAFHRAAPPPDIGVNPYGAVLHGSSVPLATGWPASVLAGGGGGLGPGELPTDAPPGAWAVLLPAIADIVLRPGDRLTDDLGRTAILGSAERTDLGWRLQARQTTT